MFDEDMLPKYFLKNKAPRVFYFYSKSSKIIHITTNKNVF